MIDAVPVLNSILTIIGYQEDKVAFIDNFLNLCMKESLVEYMKLLSQDRKMELQKILLEKDPSKFKEQLEPYILTEEYKKILQDYSQRLFQKYLDTIMPIISEEQKNNLYTYFTSHTENQQIPPVQGI